MPKKILDLDEVKSALLGDTVDFWSEQEFDWDVDHILYDLDALFSEKKKKSISA